MFYLLRSNMSVKPCTFWAQKICFQCYHIFPCSFSSLLFLPDFDKLQFLWPWLPEDHSRALSLIRSGCGSYLYSAPTSIDFVVSACLAHRWVGRFVENCCKKERWYFEWYLHLAETPVYHCPLLYALHLFSDPYKHLKNFAKNHSMRL